jgi:ATP-dependent RNA helicase DDX24/MAK5
LALLTICQHREDHIEPEVDVFPGMAVEKDTKENVVDLLQTFVFSATLSKDLQRNLKKRSRPKGGRAKKHQKPATTLGKFDSLARFDGERTPFSCR